MLLRTNLVRCGSVTSTVSNEQFQDFWCFKVMQPSNSLCVFPPEKILREFRFCENCERVFYSFFYILFLQTYWYIHFRFTLLLLSIDKNLFAIYSHLFNPLCTICLFLYSLKTSQNQEFSDDFRGYVKRPVARNGLHILLFFFREIWIKT